ncbi:HNH endonuclease [Natrarchaeobius halalkaliphilus]|uniref:HNH endonuclease n=1 Tax=Natrarchaeobius halalkaliphilus TaxID=1679091 RepID=A0A3N6LQ37_9EURY|nr:HNH endonuclease [Natrarchaeobius halalkaliphilus]RQG91688.1 HNH endonuclease [Natrarchaeobius halalkaliphilus]
MTLSERDGRDVVIERDEYTCRRCGKHADDDPRGLQLYSVSDRPAETVHDSALVTVCSPCFASLASDPDDACCPDETELFSLVRETTEREGVAVSAVANFASVATELPGELERTTADPVANTRVGSTYVRARRETLLAIDSVDSHLDRLSALESATYGFELSDPLDSFVETGIRLQSQLRGIVSLNERIVAGLEHCHGCFGVLEDGTSRCSACALERRDVDDWCSNSDDAIDFERLFTAINETLQAASGTTETLTDRTTTVAERLHGEP